MCVCVCVCMCVSVCVCVCLCVSVCVCVLCVYIYKGRCGYIYICKPIYISAYAEPPSPAFGSMVVVLGHGFEPRADLYMFMHLYQKRYGHKLIDIRI